MGAVVNLGAGVLERLSVSGCLGGPLEGRRASIRLHACSYGRRAILAGLIIVMYSHK